MIYKRETDIMHNPAHPGEILREDCIKPLGLTIKEAALKLGITRQNLSDIVHCKTAVSPAMAIKLAKAFNTSPDVWLGMQMQYDLWKAKQITNVDNVQIMYG
ncbi:MAG: HigA family addiction module antitoxin [bacterium]